MEVEADAARWDRRSGWSVAELEAYIARLEVEMARARVEIENKNSVRNAAEALFKKS